MKREIKFRKLQQKRAMRVWIEIHRVGSDEQLNEVKRRWARLRQKFEVVMGAKNFENNREKLLKKIVSAGDNYEEELREFLLTLLEDLEGDCGDLFFFINYNCWCRTNRILFICSYSTI